MPPTSCWSVVIGSLMETDWPTKEDWMVLFGIFEIAALDTIVAVKEFMNA